jgi:CheY-like chemotaxis protein
MFRSDDAHRLEAATTMTVFVSHSFDNLPEFENVTDALELRGIPYWKPSEVKSGDSLRDQLRSAVSMCTVCVFVATQLSVRSSWCGAELGAFWGAGIPIIVYLAEASLKEDALPPIVQGDVWERNLSRMASRAKELVENSSTGAFGESLPPATRISTITVEQLEKLVVGAVSLVQAGKPSDAEDATSHKPIDAVVRQSAGLVLRGVQATSTMTEDPDENWRKQILWVDDLPNNNVYERKAFESFGIEFTLAESTGQALDILKQHRFAAIISDMGRAEGPREGYKLLAEVRSSDSETPFFIYAGSRAVQHKREAQERGAQGTTNIASELIDMVIAAIAPKQQRDADNRQR